MMDPSGLAGMVSVTCIRNLGNREQRTDKPVVTGENFLPPGKTDKMFGKKN